MKQDSEDHREPPQTEREERMVLGTIELSEDLAEEKKLQGDLREQLLELIRNASMYRVPDREGALESDIERLLQRNARLKTEVLKHFGRWYKADGIQQEIKRLRAAIERGEKPITYSRTVQRIVLIQRETPLSELSPEQVLLDLEQRLENSKMEVLKIAHWLPKKEARKLVRMGLREENPAIQSEAIAQVALLPQGERTAVLEADLEKGIRIRTIRQLWCIPAAEQARLLKRIIPGSTGRDEQYAIWEAAKKLPASFAEELVQVAFETDNTLAKFWALGLLPSVAPAARAELVRKAMNDESMHVLSGLAMNISFVPETLMKEVIEKLLSHPENRSFVKHLRDKVPSELLPYTIERVLELVRDGDDRDCIFHAMPRVAPEERIRLLEMGIEDSSFIVRITAAQQAQYLLHIPDREKVIRKLLHHSDFGVVAGSLRMIPFLPSEKRRSYVEELRASDDFYSYQLELAKILPGIPEEERLPLQEELLHSSMNHEVIEEALRSVISHTPPQKRLEMILKVYRIHPNRFRPVAQDLFGFLDEEDKKTLLAELGDEEALIALASENRLYIKEPAGRPYFRHRFHKHGSGTLLLDQSPDRQSESLKRRVILREISPSAYENWFKAYSCPDFWRRQGFDYVPIEPIIAAYPKRNEPELRVYSGVLNGPPISDWIDKTLLYSKECGALKHRILEALQKLGVDHGHPHTANFVLVFHRNEDGMANLLRPPRVYLIDFDAAFSK